MLNSSSSGCPKFHNSSKQDHQVESNGPEPLSQKDQKRCTLILAPIRRNLLLLVHAFVHSRLDYCISVLVRLPWSLVQQLQSVLNSAARLIFGLKLFDHITLALMDLHWLPYPQCITYKLSMIMFKCLRGSAPAYLADYCTSTSLVSG